MNMFEATYIHLDLVNDMDMNLKATTYRSTYLQCSVREWMWKTVNLGWSLIQCLWINPGDRFHEENPRVFQHTRGKYPKRPYPTVYVWEILKSFLGLVMPAVCSGDVWEFLSVVGLWWLGYVPAVCWGFSWKKTRQVSYKKISQSILVHWLRNRDSHNRYIVILAHLVESLIYQNIKMIILSYSHKIQVKFTPIKKTFNIM